MRREQEIEFTSVRMTGSVGSPGEIVSSEDEWFDTSGATTGVNDFPAPSLKFSASPADNIPGYFAPVGHATNRLRMAPRVHCPPGGASSRMRTLRIEMGMQSVNRQARDGSRGNAAPEGRRVTVLSLSQPLPLPLPLSQPLPLSLPLSLSLACLSLLILACSTPSPAAPAPAAEDGCTPGTATPPRLVFAVAATGDPDKAIRSYRPMADRIAADVGVPVDVQAFTDYTAIATAVARAEADLALLPPIAYVKAREAEPCLSLLRARVTEGAVHYSGYIVVRKDGRFRDIASLAGARIGFVSPQSASGFLFSRATLADAGLDLGSDLANARFLGTHEAVVRAVLRDDIDGGATYFEGIQAARATGAGTGELRILAITSAIPSDALVARAGLHTDLVGRIVRSLDAIHTANSEGRKALAELPQVNGWVPVRDAFYDPVRELLRRPDAPGKEAP